MTKGVSHYFTAFMKFSIMGSIVLNLFVALLVGELAGVIPVAEAIIIYALYYFY